MAKTAKKELFRGLIFFAALLAFLVVWTTNKKISAINACEAKDLSGQIDFGAKSAVYEGKEIITKDVLFLAYMQKKVGVDKYEVDGGRINVFTAKNKDLSNLGTIYFPDGLRSLSLNEAAINNPELLKFPDGLQDLYLNEAAINNPELLKFPDGLQGLHLTKAAINNPELLKFPDGLRILSLNEAVINNPELLKFPDGLLYLYLKGVKLTDAAREMLREYKKRNPGVTINDADL